MAIEKRWINWATAVCGAVLLVFCLAQAVLSFYLNIALGSIGLIVVISGASDLVAISGAHLVSLAVLVFPTVWIAFCAAISRHRGVYIAYMVMICLSLLDCIGMLVYQAVRFPVNGGYTTVGIKEFAITMTVLQSIIIVILFIALAFGAAALCYKYPGHQYERKMKYPAYPGFPGGAAPPMYSRDFSPGGYSMSLPRQAGYEYAPEPRLYYSTKGRY